MTDEEQTMRKAILIIEEPKSCEDCHICVNVIGKRYCAGKGTHISGEGRDCSCPLVAVPDEIDPKKANGAYGVGYAEGWNNCLPKITGGLNE